MSSADSALHPWLQTTMSIPWKASATMFLQTMTLPSGGLVVVPYDTVLYDFLNSLTLGVVSGTTFKYTAPVPGHYVVVARYTLGSAASSTGQSQSYIQKNGVAYASGSGAIFSNSGVNPQMQAVAVVPLQQGDYVNYAVQCISSGAVQGPNNLNGVGRADISIHWLSPL